MQIFRNGLSFSASIFQDGSDALLEKLANDMGGLFLSSLLSMLQYPNQNVFADSALVVQMEAFIPMVVKDLEALKNGSAKDKEAFNSASCQNILNFLTKPAGPGFSESLYQAALNGDNNQVAAILFYMKYNGTLNSVNGLIGQIRLFDSEWTP